MKSTKERNAVDLFSDYGLDERQKAMSAKIGFESFKALFNSVVVITIMWVALYGAQPEFTPHYKYVILSYFAAAIVIQCVYAVKAAKQGIINGITAFSYTTGSFVSVFVCLAVAVLMFVFNAKTPFDGYYLGGMLIGASVEHAVLYWCGKKNFKVIDEENEEE